LREHADGTEQFYQNQKISFHNAIHSFICGGET
jgi:hypothetical protein